MVMETEVKFPIKNPNSYNNLLLKGGAKLVHAYTHYDEIFEKFGVDMEQWNYRIRVYTLNRCNLIKSYTTKGVYKDVPLKTGTRVGLISNWPYWKCRNLANKLGEYKFTIRKLAGGKYELPPFSINIEELSVEWNGFVKEIGNFSEIEALTSEFIKNIDWVNSFLDKAGIKRKKLIAVPMCAYVKQKFKL
jgi:adenylate cyclase class IV